MLVNEQLVPTIEPSDVLVTEVETGLESIQVYRCSSGQYHVLRDGVARHPRCTAEDAMRALAQYLQSALYKAQPNATEIRRMRIPADNGPIKGEAIANRMMAICGCEGKFDCDCPSVKNPALSQLWGEHNKLLRPIPV